MSKVRYILASLAVLLGVAGLQLATPVATVSAAPRDELCKGIGGCNRTDQGPTLQATIKNVTNVLLFVIGAISVIMIIVGGIRYVTSNGDNSAVSGAKNTILYAVVGLIVAMAAYAIVNFVIGAF